MEQVTAKQRIEVAAKDHATISMLHLRLHCNTIACVICILCALGLVAFIIVGIAQPNIESEWIVTNLEEPIDWL